MKILCFFLYIYIKNQDINSNACVAVMFDPANLKIKRCRQSLGGLRWAKV